VLVFNVLLSFLFRLLGIILQSCNALGMGKMLFLPFTSEILEGMSWMTPKLSHYEIYLFIFSRVIQNIIDSRPRVRYLVAVDDSKNTLEEVVKVI
jgi:hypothetical protein